MNAMDTVIDSYVLNCGWLDGFGYGQGRILWVSNSFNETTTAERGVPAESNLCGSFRSKVQIQKLIY